MRLRRRSVVLWMTDYVARGNTTPKKLQRVVPRICSRSVMLRAGRARGYSAQFNDMVSDKSVIPHTAACEQWLSQAF